MIPAEPKYLPDVSQAEIQTLSRRNLIFNCKIDLIRKD